MPCWNCNRNRMFRVWSQNWNVLFKQFKSMRPVSYCTAKDWIKMLRSGVHFYKPDAKRITVAVPFPNRSQ